jgi:ribonuclease HII
LLKGPVIGPMVICGVIFIKSNLSFLDDIGVKDSKKLSPKKRIELASKLKKEATSYKIIEVSPQEIDAREKERITLNRLEVIKMSEIINILKPDYIYIDAADVNELRFKESIESLIEYSPMKIISRHKADDLYPIVSASSIIAKQHRDSIINNLHQKYGNFGSGYPSDIKTVNFLRDWIKKHRKCPPFARRSWETTKKILDEEILNKKITDYFNF